MISAAQAGFGSFSISMVPLSCASTPPCTSFTSPIESARRYLAPVDGKGDKNNAANAPRYFPASKAGVFVEITQDPPPPQQQAPQQQAAPR